VRIPRLSGLWIWLSIEWCNALFFVCQRQHWPPRYLLPYVQWKDKPGLAVLASVQCRSRIPEKKISKPAYIAIMQRLSCGQRLAAINQFSQGIAHWWKVDLAIKKRIEMPCKLWSSMTNQCVPEIPSASSLATISSSARSQSRSYV
jgi:hypothetical protein